MIRFGILMDEKKNGRIQDRPTEGASEDASPD